MTKYLFVALVVLTGACGSDAGGFNFEGVSPGDSDFIEFACEEVCDELEFCWEDDGRRTKRGGGVFVGYYDNDKGISVGVSIGGGKGKTWCNGGHHDKDCDCDDDDWDDDDWDDDDHDWDDDFDYGECIDDCEYYAGRDGEAILEDCLDCIEEEACTDIEFCDRECEDLLPAYF